MCPGLRLGEGQRSVDREYISLGPHKKQVAKTGHTQAGHARRAALTHERGKVRNKKITQLEGMLANHCQRY